MTDEHLPGEGHGNTVAAWTAVAVMLIGSTISGVAVWIAEPVLFWVGVGVIVVGAIAGKVLQVMGLGQSSGQSVGQSEASTGS